MSSYLKLCILLLLFSSSVVCADYQLSVLRSSLTEDTRVTNAMIVVVDGSNAANYSQTEITGNDDPDVTAITILFALDDVIDAGADIEAAFVFFECGIANSQRMDENNHTYFPGPASLTNFPVEGLIEECEEANQPGEPFAFTATYPNPGNGTVRISFGLPEATSVTLSLVDLAGDPVATLLSGVQNRGLHSLNFNTPSAVPMGLYHLVLQTAQDSLAGNIVLQSTVPNWQGDALVTTDAQGRCFIPASLLPNGELLNMSDVNGISQGTANCSIGIVLEINGERVNACLLNDSAMTVALDYRITLQ